jgi:hypothetical protein
MLRKITIGCAVVVAMLAAPVTLSARSMGGMGGMHSMGGMGGMHSFGGVHSFGGPHNFGMAGRWGGVHSFHHSAFFPGHHFAHFDHFHHFDPSLPSLPAPLPNLRHRYWRRLQQLLGVGANAMGLAPSVGLRLMTAAP